MQVKVGVGRKVPTSASPPSLDSKCILLMGWAGLAEQELTLPGPSNHQVKASDPPLLEEALEATAWQETTQSPVCPLYPPGQ